MVHCLGVPDEAVKKEAIVISELGKNGGHTNIIKILKDGWNFDFYFIDLEYCDWTLSEYLSGKFPKSVEGGIQSLWPSVELRQEGPSAHNVCVISAHIVEGLQFIHSKGFAHRDLKPSNGTECSFRTINDESIIFR